VLHGHTAPYENYGLTVNQVNLSTDWAIYTIDFTTSNFAGPVEDARLRMWFAPFAQAGDQYWIDAVSLVNMADVDEGEPVGTAAVVTDADGMWVGLGQSAPNRSAVNTFGGGNTTGAADIQLFLPLIDN
jgi:hypothetical protein